MLSEGLSVSSLVAINPTHLKNFVHVGFEVSHGACTGVESIFHGLPPKTF